MIQIVIFKLCHCFAYSFWMLVFLRPLNPTLVLGSLHFLLPLGNLLSNDCLRYAVALRTDSIVCQNFTFRCGEKVDKFGLHSLSCVQSGGRYPRHCALNDIVFRALNVAGFNSILEPSGLDFDCNWEYCQDFGMTARFCP